MALAKPPNPDDHEPTWLIPKPIERLTGQEHLSDTASTVLDFWRWAFSDLRMNILRGILAEYLVAQATGDQSPIRDAWGNWDVTTAADIKVEIKASGYLQSWNQRNLSSIQFGRLTGREWSPQTNELAASRSLRADVYVFAVHTCRDPDQYDPLSIQVQRYAPTVYRLNPERSVSV